MRPATIGHGFLDHICGLCSDPLLESDDGNNNPRHIGSSLATFQGRDKVARLYLSFLRHVSLSIGSHVKGHGKGKQTKVLEKRKKRKRGRQDIAQGPASNK